jgi:hypothetical protein
MPSPTPSPDSEPDELDAALLKFANANRGIMRENVLEDLCYLETTRAALLAYSDKRLLRIVEEARPARLEIHKNHRSGCTSCNMAVAYNMSQDEYAAALKSGLEKP